SMPGRLVTPGELNPPSRPPLNTKLHKTLRSTAIEGHTKPRYERRPEQPQPVGIIAREAPAINHELVPERQDAARHRELPTHRSHWLNPRFGLDLAPPSLAG